MFPDPAVATFPKISEAFGAPEQPTGVQTYKRDSNRAFPMVTISKVPRLIRVLVVEDEPDDFALVEALLSRRTVHRYQLEWAPTYEKGLEALGRQNCDLVLLDHRLGARTGLEWLRAAGGADSRVPIILLTGDDRPEIDQEAADAGAADYLCKNKLDAIHLERSIRYALRHAEDLAERRRLESQVLSISDEQQRKIGGDIHDDLGQHLTGIACLAGALRDQLKTGQSALAENAHQIAGLVNGAIELARMLARGLCPVPLEYGGLNAALEDLAFSVQRMHGISCTFEPDTGAVAVDPAIALHLYRIAQEAVNNAIRHGAADRISVRLDVGGTPASLVIEDNGRGFDREGKSPGLGLHLMEQRADIIGGGIRIVRSPRGMRVECSFARPDQTLPAGRVAGLPAVPAYELAGTIADEN